MEHELHDDVEAERLFQEAVAIERKRYGDSHLSVALSTSGLAKAVQGQQRLDEAERLCRQAIAVERSVVGDKHRAIGVRREQSG